jgi:hypothetical protein
MVNNINPTDMNTNPALLDLYLVTLFERESSSNYYATHKPSVITDINTGEKITVQALGGYGILDINFPVWAKQAGLEGADWKDTDAQDKVARYKVQEYFNTFGSWDLVSVAWFAGPEKAKELKAEGTIDMNKRDSKGTSIGDYVASMNNLMTEELMNIEVPIEPVEIKEQPTPVQPVGNMTNNMNGEKYAAQLLNAMTRANAGGERPSVGLDFEQQAPPQVVDQVSQYTQTIEKAYQEYLDSVI